MRLKDDTINKVEEIESATFTVNETTTVPIIDTSKRASNIYITFCLLKR